MILNYGLLAVIVLVMGGGGVMHLLYLKILLGSFLNRCQLT